MGFQQFTNEFTGTRIVAFNDKGRMTLLFPGIPRPELPDDDDDKGGDILVPVGV